MRITHFVALCLIAAISFFSVPAARAAYFITVNQVGPDVVATGSGSFNLGGLSADSSIFPSAHIDPSNPAIILGPTSASLDTEYSFGTSPGNFGPGSNTNANLGTGASVGIRGQSFDLPQSYASGGNLGTSTATWTNQTFATLGIIPGTYVSTWGSGATADKFTVHVLPEPASLSLIAIAGLALLRRR
ncbi:MAG TPA: hypothetical protein VHS31_10210 [Tepidisphaeraceae bacterium]|jgi:hypothetical protein|nr:hypothetical protein [Tepidisphaeraceae bacterium]